MSRAGVGTTIETLLTDERLRLRLACDRVGTAIELFKRDFDLTKDEIDLFLQADASLWFMGDVFAGDLTSETALRGATARC